MLTVPDLLQYGATLHPARLAVVTSERSLTFAGVDERASRLASYLRERGVGPGDRVGLLAMNEAEYLEVLVACQRLGAISVPLNFRLAVPELAFICADSDPQVLVHGPGFAPSAGALGIAQVIGFGPEYEAALAATAPVPERPLIAAAAPSTILYTSGTTGRPNGAVISNQALWARISSNVFEYRISADDVFLQALPLFHIASNVTSSYTAVGATNVLVRQFDPGTVLDLVTRHRVTAALLVPTMINMVVNHPDVEAADLSSLHTVAYGASPIPPAVLERALHRIDAGFVQLFGMTETSGCTVLRRSDHDPVRFPQRLAAAGTEAWGYEVRVVDDDDRDVAAGAVGEVICRGPAMMDGYWNAPEATTAALRGGWMHTGDLGYRDGDGYLYVTDRKKDMVVSGGENVYPREVEDVLFSHPAVLDAAVIGVRDERWGERVHAVVVRRPGPEFASVTDHDVMSFARERLAGYKLPRSLEWVSELPRNATGKVLKTELRARHWHGRERGVS
jgi:acyl-CoA synthetase (AMP-forming)/AMP-acid ligase II